MALNGHLTGLQVTSKYIEVLLFSIDS